MTGILLFCIAEGAKSFVRKALEAKHNIGDVRIFYLVESRTLPNSSQAFKEELKDDETFETDFIGASTQDCQNWALEQQYRVNFIEQNIIAIADERSAEDDTLLMQFYNDGEPLEFPEFGLLPREHNTWYDFRVDQSKADLVFASLQNGAFDAVFPVYFGRKEELTDERGVFDVTKAELLIGGQDPDTDLV